MRPIRNRVTKIVAIAVFALTLLAASSSPVLAWGGCERTWATIERFLSIDDGGVLPPALAWAGCERARSTVERLLSVDDGGVMRP